jgi:O-antigen/teichoic acid export membrane protein
MLANVIGIGLGLVRTPAMTWLLPKDEVGMIGVLAAWQPFLIFLTWPSSLSAAAYHYVAKGQPAAFTVMLSHQLRWSLLSVLGFWVAAAYWWWQENETLTVLFVIGGLSYPLTIVLASCAGMLAAQERFVALFWYRIGHNLANFSGFLLVVLSVWWVSRVITFYAVNQMTLAVLQLGITVWSVWQLRQAQTPPMPPEEKQEMMRYGKHLTGINGIGVLQTRADQLLVGTLLPLATMADYTVGLLFQAQLKQLWGIYVAVRYPPLVRMPVRQRQRRILLEGVIMWLGFVGLGLAMSIAAHWLIPLILPLSYLSSLNYIGPLIAVMVIGTPGGIIELFFRTEQDEKRQYIMRIIAAILSVTLPLAFIFKWGIYGVIFGRFLANCIFSAVGIWLFVQVIRQRIFDDEKDYNSLRT